MTNHLHIVAIPETDSSMANTFRHAHGRFSQYWNTELKRSGHLWQNRYYSCTVEEAAAGRVIAYVENNPVRAGMVKYAGDFEWSSARAHLGQVTDGVTLDEEWWQARWTVQEWKPALLNLADQEHELRAIREATYTGRPFGSKEFVAALEEKLGRELGTRRGGRPKRDLDRSENQLGLWATR
jgi:putative transposase